MRWVGPPELDLGHPVAENRRDIDISHLSSGVYMLRVTLPQGVAIRKVVKK